MNPIPINLAVEDELFESLARKILSIVPTKYATQTIYNRGGAGYLRKNINGFNNGAKGTPFWVAVDLDAIECPPKLVSEWLLAPKHHNLLITVAVREAEAWLLADRSNFSRFLGLRGVDLPNDVEALTDPKRTVVDLARKCRNRRIRDDICPREGTASRVGPNYNALLGRFIRATWDPQTARANSRSLDRTIERLTHFRPSWVTDDEG